MSQIPWIMDPPLKPGFREIFLNGRQKLTKPRPWPDRLNEGWDTETVDGHAFVMANSHEWRRINDLDDCLQFLTQKKHRGVRNCWWNLRYDATAIFKHDYEVLKDLELTGSAQYGRYELYYLRGKYLKIRDPSNHIYHHYDVAGFYFASLKAAAERYLNRQSPDLKDDRANIADYPIQDVGEYCRWDATATKDLTDLYVERLARVDLYPKHLISGGNVAQALLLTHADVPTWRNCPSLANRLGWMAQRGAWIDVWKRGEITGWKYDIKSAYPAEMAEMPDLRGGQWVHDKDPADAAYGFVRAVVRYGPDTAPVIAHHVPPTNVYADINEPRKVVITLDEYRYIKETGGRADADMFYSFIPADNPRYPWADLIRRLCILKDEESFKKTLGTFDPGFYLALKGLINSLYGKTCEKIPHNDGSIEAGRLFAPVISSHTLARTRLKVARAAKGYLRDVGTIATDCLVTTRPITGLDIGDQLGQWDIEAEGAEAMLFQPGVYQMRGKDPQTRGFKPYTIGMDNVRTKIDLWEIAKKGGKTFTITTERPYSGRQAAHWGRPEIANIFDRFEYTINVPNTRRLWKNAPQDFGDLLGQTYDSAPIPIGACTT